MVNMREVTLDFENDVLFTCLETTSVRLERISRRLKQADERLEKYFAESFSESGRRQETSN